MNLRYTDRPVRGLLAALLFVPSVALAVSACSDSEDPGAPSAPTGDAGVLDAAPEDARLPFEAGDATPRECSDDNFCRTALPPEETLRDVWGDGTILWSVSEEGDVLRWDGAAWSVQSGGYGALYAVWGSGPTDLWIGGEKGLYHGTGASSAAITWTLEAVPGSAKVPIRSIWGTGPEDIWASGGKFDQDSFGAKSRVLHYGKSEEAGAAWTLDAISSAPFAFTRVWGSAESGTWLGGDDAMKFPQQAAVYRRAKDADAFVRVVIPPPQDDLFRAFTGAGAIADGPLVVLGRGGVSSGTWRSAKEPDGAYTWLFEAAFGTTLVSEPLTLRAVWGTSASSIWVAGDYGRLRHWDGATWTQASLAVSTFPLVEPLYGIWGASADDFWVVGRRIALHRKPGKGP